MNIQEADTYKYLSLSRTRSTTTAKDSLRRADDKELKTQETAQQTLWRNMTTSYQYWPTLMLREICALQVTVSGPTGCILDNKARHLTRINIRGERGDGGKLTRWIMDLPRASTYRTYVVANTMVMFCWGKNIKEVILAAIDTSTNIIIAQGSVRAAKTQQWRNDPTTKRSTYEYYLYGAASEDR